jgi:hypothetical protein
MLITNRDQFALYATHHRAKVSRWQADIELFQEQGNDEAVINLQKDIADTIAKAEANEQMVRDIQAVISEPDHNTLAATAAFAEIAYSDGISEKNQQTQIGVHFEEVAEMIAEVKSDNGSTVILLATAHGAISDLASNLKNTDPSITIPDRLAFLDACCDQLVTATLSAKLQGMDPVGGLNEVNRSIYSKLVDGVMTKAPITAKWIKGPNYSEPDLTPFV